VVRVNKQRANAALQLRLAGAPWSTVAEVHNYADAKAAQEAVEKMLAGTATEADRVNGRNLARARYERLLAAIWGKAINAESPEQLPAARAAREFVDRIVALDGLAMPQQVVVHNPSSAEIQAWIAEVAGRKFDVVEAEVIDLPELEGGTESA
jgi:hypothetical protein